MWMRSCFAFTSLCSSLCFCCPRSKHDRRRVRSSLTNTHRKALSTVLSLLRAARSDLLFLCRRFTATASGTSSLEASLPRECLAHFACSPGRRRLDVSSRARHRLSVTFEMLESCVAGLTQCLPRHGSCPSRCQWRIRH